MVTKINKKSFSESMSNDAKKLCKELDDYLIYDDMKAASIASLSDGLSVDDIVGLANDNLISYGYDVDTIRVGDLSYYVFDSPLLVRDAVAKILEEEFDIDEVNEENLIKFANEDYFEYRLNKRIENDIDEIINIYDDTYGNQFIRQCWDSGIMSYSDFEEDLEGNTLFDKCTVPLEDLINDFVDYIKEEQSNNAVTAFIDRYGEVAIYDEIYDYPKSAFLTSEYCEYKAKNIDNIPEILATYDGIERHIDTPETSYSVYRIR